MYYRRMSRDTKYIGLIAICGPVVLLWQLAVFLVAHKTLILLIVFVFWVIKKVGIKSILSLILYPFVLVINKFIQFTPHYFFPKLRKSRTFADRCGIGFSKLNDNNYDAIKLDSVSVAPLDETDIHAFRNTPAYKKMQAANKINAVKQYASY